MAGKLRSPNYPALPLMEAIQAAERLWDAEKRTAVSHDAAALALGFKALSGPARVTIGALRQYGLIDKAEKGHIRLSDLAVRIIHGEGNDGIRATVEAATTPPLFKELAQTHAEGSETSIKSYLITKKGFSEDGARKAAKAFRETISLVTPSDSGYNPQQKQEKPEAVSVTDMGQSNRPSGETGALSLKVPYGTGALAVEIRVSGEPLKRAHIERVRKYLELAEDDLPNGESGGKS